MAFSDPFFCLTQRRVELLTNLSITFLLARGMGKLNARLIHDSSRGSLFSEGVNELYPLNVVGALKKSDL